LNRSQRFPGPATTLNGKDAFEIAAMPGPASTAKQIVEVTSAPFSLAAGAEGDFSVSCPGSDYVISGVGLLHRAARAEGHPLLFRSLRFTASCGRESRSPLGLPPGTGILARPMGEDVP